jgi:octanoyl-[GcvH]:protein N-octanoyltransferase
MDLITTAHADRPELDMALTQDLLDGVARGERGELMRVYRPGPTLAFGRSDRGRPGFDAAWRIGEAHGRTPVIRLAGGHAAAYDQDCLILESFSPHERSAPGAIESRFAAMADLITLTLARLGVALELGELPREYCAGRYSLHLPSGPKVAGVAQRVLTRASLTTAVLVVGGGSALRALLAEVYAALDLPLDLSTAGAVDDQHPGITAERVARAVLDGLADQARLAS